MSRWAQDRRPWQQILAERHLAAGREDLAHELLAEGVDWTRDPAEVDVQAELTEMFRRVGLNEQDARAAGRGRDSARAEDGFGRLLSMFQGVGLSEAEARRAAVGRDGSEDRARAQFTEAEIVAEAARLSEAQAAEKAAQAFLAYAPGLGIETARDHVRDKARSEWGMCSEAVRKRRLVEYAHRMRAAANAKSR